MPSDAEFFTIPPLVYFSPEPDQPEQSGMRAPAQVESDGIEAKIERLVAARTSEMRRQIGALEAAREEDKRALARRLHDELGSALTVLNMHFAILLREMPEAPTLLARSAQIKALLRTISQAASDIQHQVRPELLDVFGIKAAIAEHAHEFERHTGIACRVDLPDEDLTYPPQVEIILFRTVQDALNAIASESIATHVDVVLDDVDDRVVLSIRENYAATNARRHANDHSPESGSIRERVACIGGDMSIFKMPGQFSCVVVTLPKQMGETME